MVTKAEVTDTGEQRMKMLRLKSKPSALGQYAKMVTIELVRTEHGEWRFELYGGSGGFPVAYLSVERAGMDWLVDELVKERSVQDA